MSCQTQFYSQWIFLLVSYYKEEHLYVYTTFIDKVKDNIHLEKILVLLILWAKPDIHEYIFSKTFILDILKFRNNVYTTLELLNKIIEFNRFWHTFFYRKITFSPHNIGDDSQAKTFDCAFV